MGRREKTPAEKETEARKKMEKYWGDPVHREKVKRRNLENSHSLKAARDLKVFAEIQRAGVACGCGPAPA